MWSRRGIAAVALCRFVLEAFSAFWIASLVQKIVVSLRTAVYDKLQRLSFRFFDANESGSIINRVTGDVQAVRMFVDQVLVNVLLMAVSLVFFTGYMLSLHVTLTLVCLATTPLLYGLTAWFSRTVKPALPGETGGSSTPPSGVLGERTRRASTW